MVKWRNCPCTGRTLPKLIHPTILTILASGNVHGYRLAGLISKTPILKGERPDSAGVYRILGGMEHEGLVASVWLPSKKGPQKKAYRLTPAGRRCLAEWTKTLSTYQQATEALLAMAGKALLRLNNTRNRGTARAR